MDALEIISVLEEKIETLLSHVANLEERNRNLQQELDENKARVAELTAKVEGLEQERADVSARVERILAKIGEVTDETQAPSQDEGHGSGEYNEGSGDLQFSDAG
ncbi:MAG: cell division protein ZapB [Thermodesulfobacteria bacterium]|nr:cell division protein ZapB [Thermodesulfobacteriota bacterium]